MICPSWQVDFCGEASLRRETNATLVDRTRSQINNRPVRTRYRHDIPSSVLDPQTASFPIRQLANRSRVQTGESFVLPSPQERTLTEKTLELEEQVDHKM